MWRDIYAQGFLGSFPANEDWSVVTQLRKPLPSVLAAPEGPVPRRSHKPWAVCTCASRKNSAMHYAQFIPRHLCWFPNSALCFLRARSSLIQNDKDNRGSTKDLTEYKGGSAEGLRGTYQNNVAQNTEITGRTTIADNIYQSFTMEGATFLQLPD